MLTGCAAFAIPALATWRVTSAAVPYMVASAALELAYFALLAAAYARADYSFAYTVARGSAPAASGTRSHKGAPVTVRVSEA